MKILIADDHMVVREGLKQILREHKNFDNIEEAKEGNEALDKINKGDYDFIILDISMPGLSGLDILQILKGRNKKINVLILSVHPQEQYAIRAFRSGASGYLSKNSAYEELALAINKISAGEKYISSAIAEKLAFNFNDKQYLDLHERLSEREFQVFCMLANGMTVREIGKKVFISEKTVSTHRSRLLEKMGMKKNSEIILYAIKNNLIE
jgi:two-component system, NarL family, invasion response regulator UvrY